MTGGTGCCASDAWGQPAAAPPRNVIKKRVIKKRDEVASSREQPSSRSECYHILNQRVCRGSQKCRRRQRSVTSGNALTDRKISARPSIAPIARRSIRAGAAGMTVAR
jgi:hypothetical protein